MELHYRRWTVLRLHSGIWILFSEEVGNHLPEDVLTLRYNVKKRMEDSTSLPEASINEYLLGNIKILISIIYI